MRSYKLLLLSLLLSVPAFALPFTLLAFAPSLLSKLPKSGGWLNSVKVVLGFVEVALEFKFLSVAGQTYHWHLLDREVYLAIWIVVFTLLGLYLLGKINSYFMMKRYHVNAQPYYVILDPVTEKNKVPARSYNLDVDEYVAFLEKGLE